MIFVIGLSVFMAFSRGKGEHVDRLLMMLVWSVSLSLLLSSTLASDYLIGYDVHREYFLALQTSIAGAWSPLQVDPYTSLLSITILPAIISDLSALSMVQIFKVVFPLIYSIVPLILYKVARKILAPSAAFLSVFLFMSYDAFYDQMLSLGREEIAELLLMLLILALLSPSISSGTSGRLTLVLLTLGFATSHYSLAYIYLAILVLSFVTYRIFRISVRSVDMTLLAITSVVLLSWYAFAASGAGILTLNGALSFVVNAMRTDLFSPATTPQLSKALGAVPLPPGILHQADRYTELSVPLLLLLGFIVFACKKEKSITERQILPIMSGGLLLLGGDAVLPGFAAALDFSRTYHTALLFISICFIYGAGFVERALLSIGSLIRRHRQIHVPSVARTLHLAAAVLFLYFLFVSGWLWAVTSDVPTSLVFDTNRMANSTNPALNAEYYADFTVLSDISAAVWLHFQASSSRSVCADATAKYHVLLSYGEFPLVTSRYYTSYLPDNCDFSHSYVYLSEFNNRYGQGSTFAPATFRISDISQQLSRMNTVYSNGAATIYASQ